MIVPLWMLLGFSLWTVGLLLLTVGVYRWSRILTGRVAIKEFRADRIEGEDWYKRSMRAHANCVENLPIFTALVFVLYATHTVSPVADLLACTVLVGRICQSLVHVCFVQTNQVVAVRFFFFLIQILSFIGMAVVVVRQAVA